MEAYEDNVPRFELRQAATFWLYISALRKANQREQWLSRIKFHPGFYSLRLHSCSERRVE